MTSVLAKSIQYCGQKAVFACDLVCSKAWGITSRPNLQLSEDEDDVEWLSDSELGDAPVDPGTYEGGHAKPRNTDEAPNKWCVRECERGSISLPGHDRVVTTDFSRRVRNRHAR
jgi:hypothetical protein